MKISFSAHVDYKSTIEVKKMFNTLIVTPMAKMKIHLISTVVNKNFKHGGFFSTCVQERQIVKRGVDRTVGPVLKLPRQMTNFLIFNLPSDNVLKNLEKFGNAAKCCYIN